VAIFMRSAQLSNSSCDSLSALKTDEGTWVGTQLALERDWWGISKKERGPSLHFLQHQMPIYVFSFWLDIRNRDIPAADLWNDARSDPGFPVSIVRFTKKLYIVLLYYQPQEKFENFLLPCRLWSRLPPGK
jgi:hypothetical protein